MLRAGTLLVLLVMVTTGVLAVQVSGKVTGSANDPLAYANVYVKGTTNGTTTNNEGFYKLDVPAGNIELVFRFVGYKMKIEKIFAGNEPITVNVTLEKENYTLKEINISAEAEDPAYAIIRNAISKRKFYLHQVDEFSCDVYVKGLQKLTKYPDKLFGMDVNLDEFIDTTTGIVYLSESVSKYYFKQPDEEKEIMVSSKVSGSNKAFSFNQASDMDFNFYENIMMVGQLSQRGFISPISSSAMLYYRYRLDGSFYENETWVNKIEVIPRRKNDPVFSGYIYIQDSTWRIHSVDLTLTRNAQIEFVDTLTIGQVYIPVESSGNKWLLGSVTFNFVFSAFGFEGNGNFVGVYSNYDLSPALSNKFFRGSKLKIEEESNQKDSLYWNEIRPLRLTDEEQNDYVKRDSLRLIKESEPYLDSLDRETNKFSVGKLFSGYTYRNRYKKSEYFVSSLIDAIQFNTVEGLNIGLSVEYEKELEKNSMFSYELNGRYGFSNEQISGDAQFSYLYNVRKFSLISISGGDDLVQYNESNPISPLINTGYTLFDEKNYMKLYRKQFGKIEYRTEPVNGIRLNVFAEYSHRSAVTNNTDYSFSDRHSENYTSNNPLNPFDDTPAFENNDAFKLNLRLRFRIRQKYIDRPDFNYIIGSKYPSFLINCQAGVKGIAGSDIDYTRIEAGVTDDIRLGMAGTLSYLVIYGKFLNNSKMYFTDYTHFNGNRTFFSGFETRRFELLDYYAYSTNDEYVQAFAEHSFGGLIMNKIPGLRKLKLNEVAGFRYLYLPQIIQHYEISFGLEKLGLLRADFVVSFDDNGNTKTGFVIGIKQNISR